MALSAEQMKVYQQQRRAREKEEKDAASRFIEKDTTGTRYKSEVLSFEELTNLYYGIKKGVDAEETEKRKKEKRATVKPSGSLILGEKRTFDEWLELRDRARKDLFWLGRDILKKDLIETTHRVVCEQFVQKNFDGAYPEGYTIGDVHKAIDRQKRYDDKGNETKELLLLDPRGFYKSTIDGIDCVQWLLNVPDIRILILTGEYKLAVAFMREIKEYFYLPHGSDCRDLHLLFPDYVLTGVDGTSKEPLECPARKHGQKEASLWVNSIDSNLSGWHCDIRKGDDIVTDGNCESEAAREKLKEKFDGTDNLLDEWGFADNIGTRYYTDDWYAKRLHPEDPDDFVPLKYFWRQCWVVKPGFEEVPLKQLTEDMVTLNFPEKATFKSLQKKLLKNERSFRNQQLNEPSDSAEDTGFKIAFTEDVLRAHMYQATAAPQNGDVFICWDWAPSSGKYSDYSCGVAARVVLKDRVVQVATEDRPEVKEKVADIIILEIVHDRWKPSELAFQIVAFNKKWNPKQTLIEKSNGAELLQLELQRQAMKFGVSLNVYWKPVSLQADAKRNRIKSLETLLNDNRLWFVIGPWIDQMIYQLIRYTGERKNKGRKDDIADAMSFLSFFLPTTIQNEDMKALQEAQQKAANLRMNYERIFGGQPRTQPDAVIITPPTDPRSKFGIPGLRYN
jgi:phage terminase large subunit-like protein